MIIFCTRSVLLLKVNVCAILPILKRKICTENVANPLEDSQKSTSFFEFSHVRSATGFNHSRQSILPRFFYDAGFLSGY